MDSNLKELCPAVVTAAADGSRDFGQIVGSLIEAGFDGYLVDFRSALQTFYLPDGRHHGVAVHPIPCAVAESFDATIVKEAIREAQTKAPGYTYHGFCAKVAQAGCAGYLVSFPGKRVLYFGRSGDTHTEYFPGAAQ